MTAVFMEVGAGLGISGWLLAVIALGTARAALRTARKAERHPDHARIAELESSLLPSPLADAPLRSQVFALLSMWISSRRDRRY